MRSKVKFASKAYFKGTQVMHVRISYHFLADLDDLHITRHVPETDSEKRIRNI